MQKIFSVLRDKHEQLFRFLLFILTLVLIINFFPRQGSFKYEFSKGKPWLHETIIAPFSFSILKPIDEIKKEQRIIKQEHRPIFNYQSNIFEIKAEEYVASFEEKWATKEKIKKDKHFTFLNLFKKKKLDNSSKKNTLVNFGYNKLFTIYEQGIIQMSGDFSYKDDEFRILVKEGEVAESRTLGDYFTVEHVANTFNVINTLSDDEYDFLIPILLSSIEHNVVYDKVASEQLLSSELAQINNIRGLVQEGEIIVSKGEVVDNEKYQKLLSLKHEYEGQEWSESSYYLVFLG